MTDVSIRKCNVRYKLPNIDVSARGRLAGLQQRVFEQAFDLALRKAKLPYEAEICIRRLEAQINLRLDLTDESLVLNWSNAFAAEIFRLLCASSGVVIVYRSRCQALFDFAVGVASGEMERAWAWRQLGFTGHRSLSNDSDAMIHLVNALCAEPMLIVPILRALANDGLLAQLAVRLPQDAWQQLAAAVFAPVTLDQPLSDVADENADNLCHALRVFRTSELIKTFRACGLMAATSRSARASLAALALIEVEPVLAGKNIALPVIQLIVDSDVQTINSQANSELATEQVDTTTATKPIGDAAVVGNDEGLRHSTQFGGLLFLLCVLEELELPEQILANQTLASRSLSWVLYQLALNFVDVEASDPAALAFAGLAPNAKLPVEIEAEPSSAETHELRKFAQLVSSHLSQLLSEELDDEISAMEFVCRRRAYVTADPGWIDVTFSIDEVSTAIRRAGLDLNPGYVPWLGVVLRFLYE